MKIQVVGVEYNVSLTVKQMEKLMSLQYYQVMHWFDSLSDVDNINWDAHFGPNFFFRVRLDSVAASVEALRVFEILKAKLK